MAELRIRTTRHTTRVSAPPREVYQLLANVDQWPRIFDTVLAVEHIGFVGTGERVRFWGTFGDRRGSWVYARETNPKRMQVRFRQDRVAAPFASLGGLWLVQPKGDGAQVALDHYYRVLDDDPAGARQAEDVIERSSPVMLAALRRVAEVGFADAGQEDDMWFPLPDPVGGRLEGVRLT